MLGGKAGSDTADPDTYFQPYYYLSPHLPADIERRGAQAQDPKLLRALERCLVRKRNNLGILDEELRNDPHNEELRDHIIYAQKEAGLIQESIQRVKEGTYHLR